MKITSKMKQEVRVMSYLQFDPKEVPFLRLDITALFHSTIKEKSLMISELFVNFRLFLSLVHI